MEAMKDFSRAMCGNVLMHQHFTAWQHGDFASFEEMLLRLCVRFAADNERLRQEVCRLSALQPPAVV